MKRINPYLLLLHIILISVFISVFISFRYQLKIKNETDSGQLNMSWEEVSKIPLLPNVGVTTMPIQSLKALYKLIIANENATDLLKEGSKANPYIKYSEYILATYFLKYKQLDSAEFYANIAFYDWPKNISHYKLLNKILEAKKDTSAILDAYSFINERFLSKDKYYLSFVDAYSNARLRYMIFEYKDMRSINMKDLIGDWQQVYEFEGGQIQKIKNLIKFDNEFFSNETSKYKYELEQDTLLLSFINSGKVISKIPIFYSDSLQTLILKNIPMNVTEDVPELQNQFFKKIE